MPAHAPAYAPARATESRPKTAGGSSVPPAASGSAVVWPTALHDVLAQLSL
jgi:hypothetical protein